MEIDHKPTASKKFTIVDYLVSEFRQHVLQFPGTYTQKINGDFNIFRLLGTYGKIEEFSDTWNRTLRKYEAEYIEAINIHNQPEKI